MHLVNRVVLMMVSILDTVNNVKSASYPISHDAEFLSASGRSFFWFSEFLQKALPDDLSLSVVHFHS